MATEEKTTSAKKRFAAAAAIALAASLLVGGTLSYLQDTAENPAVNTFDTNQVKVDLTESGSGEYSIIPGTSEVKDPTVTVTATVDAYVFVRVTDETGGLVTYSIADGWAPLAGYDGVYFREVSASGEEQSFNVLAGNRVSYSADLTNEDMLDESGKLKDGITLSFNASAIQAAGFAGAAKAYNEIVGPDVWDGTADAAGLSENTDEAAQTVLITTAAQLQALAQAVNSGDTYSGYTVTLGRDIDLNENTAWAELGSSSSKPFGGTLDGDGYRITGIKSKCLVHQLQNGAIKNLSVTVDNSASVTHHGLTTYVYSGAIENVTVNGSAKDAAFALYVYRASGADTPTTITSCTNNAAVTSTSSSYSGGGFVTKLQTGQLTITDSTNNGAVTCTRSTGAKAVGFVAVTAADTQLEISNCVNNGAMSVTSTEECYAAGFLGFHAGAATLTNCVNNGTITGVRTATGGSTLSIGGIVATNWDGVLTLTGAENHGEVIGDNQAPDSGSTKGHHVHVGGIIGLCNPGSTTTIQSAVSDGALAGKISSASNSNGVAHVGGLIGQVNNSTGTVTIQYAEITKNMTVSAEQANGLEATVDALIGNPAAGTITVADFTNASGVETRYTPANGG